MTEPRDALEHAQEEQLATYTRVGEPQPWISVLMALAAWGAIAAADIQPRWVAVPVIILMAAVVGGLAGYSVRRAGAIPRMRTMPAPLRRVMIAYYVVMAIIMGALALWAFTGAVLAGAIIVAALTTNAVYRRRARSLADGSGPAR
jgi:hypothetical protein